MKGESDLPDLIFAMATMPKAVLEAMAAAPRCRLFGTTHCPEPVVVPVYPASSTESLENGSGHVRPVIAALRHKLDGTVHSFSHQ